MHFNLTDEQRALVDMVQRFLAQEYGFEARRRILRSPEGWSREIWRKLGEMGLLALQVPEEHGGMAPATIDRGCGRRPGGTGRAGCCVAGRRSSSTRRRPTCSSSRPAPAGRR